jgi:hypothetical protein
MRYGVCRCSATIARLGHSTLGCEIDRGSPTRPGPPRRPILRRPLPQVVKLVIPDSPRQVRDPLSGSSSWEPNFACHLGGKVLLCPLSRLAE